MKTFHFDISFCAGQPAFLDLFLLEDSPLVDIIERPIVIICPGGGYSFISDREADIVAMQYLAMGYHAAVLRYSVAPACFPTALLELGKAIILLKTHSNEWCINPSQIIISGFSAGGHLAASYAVFWDKEWLLKELKISNKEFIQPNALILGYPVISSGKYAHKNSFRNLLGEDYNEKKDLVSLEKHVKEQVPRTFIWHTYEDKDVPVWNSLLFVEKLIENNVPTEFHLFEKGKHGRSLGNRLTGDSKTLPCSAWTELVHQWIESWIL